MNVELLRQVKAAILAEPQHFRMDTWSCGTAHCIAGWALKLTGNEIANVNAPASAQRMRDGRTVQEAACDELGIDTDQSDRLFVTDQWPRKIEERYDDLPPEAFAERAALAAERIDSFIASAGEDGRDVGSDDEWDWD